jgi:peptide-methionine (S)-S-oxide reductase
MFFTNPFKSRLPNADEALAGRASAILTPGTHAVHGRPIAPPFPDGVELVQLGLGCFWGAERLFWTQDGVYSTAVGYAGGQTPNPTYDEVCSGQTGHSEVVLVAFQPAILSFDALLVRFWEAHDPTQGNRQGNDIGTQYRSAIYVDNDEMLAAARRSAKHYGQRLAAKGFGGITTEIKTDQHFYYAEDYHQQYLHKVPNGYCGLAGCNVRY